jgi:biopolymer transport protein ExbD
MSRTFAPLGEMNTTPLIDVLLVLLIMFILAVPPAVDSLTIDLPSDCPACPRPPIDAVKNTLSLDAQDRMFWNGERLSQAQLAATLTQSLQRPIEPELRFQPDSRASYDAAARAMAAIKASGVSNFGFVGNERFRHFDKAIAD